MRPLSTTEGSASILHRRAVPRGALAVHNLASCEFPVYASGMPIDQDVFRAAMGRMASGVTVVTTHYAGEDHGFTATSFTSLSMDPMLVLVCVIKEQRSHLMIEQARHFAVNILGRGQRELGMRFADPLLHDRFRGLELTRGESGAPLLAGTLAWVDCRLREVIPGGDHSIFIGEVLEGFASEEDDALVYHNRRWGRFHDEE